MVNDSTYIAQKQIETIVFSNTQWDGKTMMKNRKVAIIRVRTVVAFGETETIMTAKGNVEDFWDGWRCSISPPG